MQSRVRGLLFFLLDILIGTILVLIYKYGVFQKRDVFLFLIIAIVASAILKFALYYSINTYYYKKNFSVVKDILSSFKKGKFIIKNSKGDEDSELGLIIHELKQTGKHLENVLSSQKSLIDTFQDLYNSLVFSLTSYFVVLDTDERIVFANDGFCKKFEFNLKEITGKKIEDLFYVVNAHLKGGISRAWSQEKSIVVEKSHLLSIKKISIIADIKISRIYLQGRKQVALVIDDVTSKLRKDYQLTLMTQISESIKKDEEIDRILYTMLTGVTSGSGLGFNRAMLFLLENNEYIVGKMAVGPDSLEEAIEVWDKTPSFREMPEETNGSGHKHGTMFLKKVQASRFLMRDQNILTHSLTKRHSIHVVNTDKDERIDVSMRSFLDVKECVIVPIIAGNRPIGVLIVDNKFNQVPIGNDSVELLEIFASQSALSIEGYNNLQHLRNEMDKLSLRQEAIIEAEKMAAVGKIAAHIAHEIRNPLVTMGGYSRRIVQLAKGGLDNNEKITNAGNIILKESERLEKILSNVMDFTKPSKYIKEFNSVNDVISDTIELLKNVFQERKIEVKMDLSDDLPLIKSDFNQLKQVMLNLFQNSADAMEGSGKIDVSTEYNETDVIVVVKDTGPGIDNVNPDSIFEPFFTTKVTGVGLGLANVKKIINDHDGSIKVRNSEDGSAEFKIKIPLPG